MRYFVLALLACSFACSRMPPHMAKGYSLIHEHQNQMLTNKGWIPQAVGGSFSHEDIKMLTSCFMIIADEYDMEKTREYIVKGATEFLEEINKNESALEHLNHYPFTCKDLDYSLMICSADGKLLGHTFLLKGDIMFSKADEFEHLHRINREPYEVALEKVQGELGKIPPKVVAAE